jgi:hypothetical protein
VDTLGGVEKWGNAVRCAYPFLKDCTFTFCEDVADKGYHLSEMNAQWHIDDRWDVIESALPQATSCNFIWFSEDVRYDEELPPRVFRASNWMQVGHLIL